MNAFYLNARCTLLQRKNNDAAELRKVKSRMTKSRKKKILKKNQGQKNRTEKKVWKFNSWAAIRFMFQTGFFIRYFVFPRLCFNFFANIVFIFAGFCHCKIFYCEILSYEIFLCAFLKTLKYTLLHTTQIYHIWLFSQHKYTTFNCSHNLPT